jgi:hypothetical protein
MVYQRELLIVRLVVDLRLQTSPRVLVRSSTLVEWLLARELGIFPPCSESWSTFSRLRSEYLGGCESRVVTTRKAISLYDV